MPKQIKDKDGNVYVQQQPFYKRVWFWVVVAIVVIFVGTGLSNNSGSSNNHNNDNKTAASSSSSSSQADSSSSSETDDYDSSSSATPKVYSLKQTADYNGLKIKVNSVKYSSGNEYDTPDSGKQYVIVNVTITNTSNESKDYSEADYQLNVNGNRTDMDDVLDGVNDDLTSGTLDKGASVSGSLVGQAKINASKLQLDYQDEYDDTVMSINLLK